jgi:putative DNA primase/helicase
LSWDPDQGKGIDDFLLNQAKSNGQCKPEDVLKDLLAGAKPFIETIKALPLDLALVNSELQKVLIPELLGEQLIKQLAKALDVRAEVLRELFAGPAKPKPKLSFAANYEPWHEPVDGEKLLNDVMVRIDKEATIEQHQLWVCGLWVMFTWVHPRMDFSPILYVTGPSIECGKTTILNVVGKMVRRPVRTSNVSAAAMFRLSELYRPTLLMDEAQDQLKNPEFWLVIKSGHAPGEYAIRCNPNTNDPEAFDVFCPKLLASIGRANGQIMSRSIVVEMERRAGERDRSVKESDPVFVEIRRKLARWANDVGDLKQFRIPKNSRLHLRHRDNWESLYRTACAVSSGVAQQLLEVIPSFVDQDQDFATYLLDSLRKLYRKHDQLTKDGFLGSETIVGALNQDKEAPWYTKDDKGLTVHALAARLKRYKIKPDQVWQSDISDDVRGYRYIDSRKNHNDLKRVFEQYLPSEEI